MDSDERSTLSDVRGATTPRRAVLRSVAVAMLVVVVLAGLAGLLGVRSTTTTTVDGPWTVSVEYAWVARAGLDVPWSVTVHRDGGFSGPVTVAVTAGYFDIYESQGLDPEPASQTADATRLYWTFDPPPGEDLTIDFDAYIQPSSQLGESGEVSVVDGGAPRATVSFSTFLLP
ncbi:hypothetical protein PSU4_11450 [Pseudonocardia sulfidoxydans NBRC 16205]|uniref:Uncharacterized protein n=1 Tax=Pseudonocardia sulfidoxydans NBRC 16205 TaxID=1223511 RepID=A0A511DBL5_9PSEU|nr:hypothetical protein [Pseudonocardia sulfidoxydans]GEL22191.1 hypothetical protein PSU4_11450 [Pseudonocardia sulfidoxydans NBRC 16205]